MIPKEASAVLKWVEGLGDLVVTGRGVDPIYTGGEVEALDEDTGGLTHCIMGPARTTEAALGISRIRRVEGERPPLRTSTGDVAARFGKVVSQRVMDKLDRIRGLTQADKVVTSIVILLSKIYVNESCYPYVTKTLRDSVRMAEQDSHGKLTAFRKAKAFVYKRYPCPDILDLAAIVPDSTAAGGFMPSSSDAEEWAATAISCRSSVGLFDHYRMFVAAVTSDVRLLRISLKNMGRHKDLYQLSGDVLSEMGVLAVEGDSLDTCVAKVTERLRSIYCSRSAGRHPVPAPVTAEQVAACLQSDPRPDDPVGLIARVGGDLHANPGDCANCSNTAKDIEYALIGAGYCFNVISLYEGAPTSGANEATVEEDAEDLYLAQDLLMEDMAASLRPFEQADMMADTGDDALEPALLSDARCVFHLKIRTIDQIAAVDFWDGYLSGQELDEDLVTRAREFTLTHPPDAEDNKQFKTLCEALDELGGGQVDVAF